MKRISLITLAAASALSFGALSAQAQSSAPAASRSSSDATRSTSTTTTTTTSSQGTAAVTDSKLNQFADAYVAVQKVQKEASTQLSADADASKTEQVQTEAQARIVDAIQKNGLQLDEYNQIAQLINADDDLRTRAVERIQQKTTVTP
jgi:ABC-type glycerol-3-phosphate transport system substrate-binding protein